MLVELAIGDAYGAGFEYAADSIVREKNNLSAYVQHPRHDIRPGCYTDDTQMSVAVAEAIVSDEPWTPATLAQRFVTAFKRDPREGYASGFHAFLVGAKGLMSVHAAVSEVMSNDSMSSLLRACIALTGDVDTVATVALAAGACSEEVAQDLPEQLISGLENGPFGRDFLQELDSRLLANSD